MQKCFKKFTSLVLAMMLLCGVLPFAAAVEDTTDITSDTTISDSTEITEETTTTSEDTATAESETDTTSDNTETTEVKRHLSGGGLHSLAVRYDGTLLAWGGNTYGELGDPDIGKSDHLSELTGLDVASISASGHCSIMAKKDGTVWIWGANGVYSPKMQQVSKISDAVDVCCGSGSYYVIKSDGTAWSWGINSNGELGNGLVTNYRQLSQIKVLENVREISNSGATPTCLAVLEDGTVWGWGANVGGQIPGEGHNVSTPVQISGLEDIISVSAGDDFGVALKSDGTVWTWGKNTVGELGDGTTTNCSVPTQVAGLSNVIDISAGSGHVLALKSDGRVWSWGLNSTGQLGDYTLTNRYTPVQVKGLEDIVEISAGKSTYVGSLAMKKDGSIWGWGNNTTAFRTLLAEEPFLTRPIPIFDGDPDYTGGTSVLADMPEISQLFTGENHTFALCVDGSLWAWGKNDEGQLGVGDVGDQKTPVQITGIGTVETVVAGHNHTFIICEDGTVWTWGKNDQGQLGVGNTDNQFIPVQIQ